jgi:hypothetical protein
MRSYVFGSLFLVSCNSINGWSEYPNTLDSDAVADSSTDSDTDSPPHDGATDSADASPADARRCNGVTFAPAATYPTGSNPTTLGAGDFVGDGHVDLAVGNEGGGFIDAGANSTAGVFLNTRDGTGSFAPQATYYFGGAPYIKVGHVVHNAGPMDIVAAVNAYPNEPSHVAVLANKADKSGTFAPPATYATNDYPWAVTLGTFGGAGGADIAIACSTTEVSVLLNNGSGAFGAPQTYAVGSQNPFSIAAGDFDGDGSNDDIALVELNPADVRVWLNGGSGSFGAPVTYDAGVSPYAVAVADVNGDGKVDLVVSQNGLPGSIGILRGDGHGSFGAPVTYGAGQNPEGVAVGDFNGDGHPDVAVANYGNGYGATSTLSVLLNNGDGTFAPQQTFSSGGANAWTLTVGDFNGDNRLDIAVVNSASDSLGVLLNQCE